jgi:FkbM family methyltransferase
MPVRDIPRAWIAKHRNNFVIKRIGRIADQFTRAYRNELNWSVNYNGERHALEVAARRYPGVILDVGANTGQWASMALTAAPGLNLHCFEIAPQTFASLSRNLLGRPHVHLNQVGLSSQAATLSFNYYPDSTDRSSLVALPDSFSKLAIEVRVMTGDQYLSDHGIDRVSFLKIDVEGHEMEVLQGFRNSLREGKIATIQFEHGPAHVITRHFLGDFVAFFKEFGYRVHNIYPDAITPLDYAFDGSETFAGRNFLALRDY